MNKSKFSLADLLTVLAAIIFGYISFMGANFYYICNDTVWGMSHTIGCILIALACSGALLVSAFGAKLLKKTTSNFKTSFVWEIIMLVLFGVFGVVFILEGSPFIHFFTVSEHKSEINSKLQNSIIRAENMFSEYETYADIRESNYKRTLNSVVVSKGFNPVTYNSYGFNPSNGISDQSQIDTKMFTVHADLFPSNYSDTLNNNGIKEVAIKWLEEAELTTKSWKPIGIVGVVCEIDEKSKNWVENLVELSSVRELNETATDFNYSLTFEDSKTYFTTTGSASLKGLLTAVFIYLLMLFSWMITKRDTRPYNKIAKYEVVL